MGGFFKGIFPIAQTPVIYQRPFAKGIISNNVVDRLFVGKLPGFLSRRHQLSQQSVVNPVVVDKLFFAFGRKLGGVKPFNKFKINGIFQHVEQLLIKKKQLVYTVAL